MKTQYYAASSLDGFIATEDHNLDWLLQFGSPDNSSYPSFIREVGAIVMGSSTFEWLIRHQDKVRETTGVAEPWPYEQPTWVFTTRTLPAIPGADIRFVQGDVRTFHPQMVEAAGGKNIWVVGGGELAGQFHDHDLLDELIVQITPVTLGDGLPLFPRTITSPPFELLSASSMGPFVELRYNMRHGRKEFMQPAG
jgi:dihydrofolate reductase